MTESGALGLIAGSGRLPLLFARSARASGRRVHAIALHALSDAGVEAEADSCEWLHLGEFARRLASFASSGAREVALAGKVPKAFLWQQPGAVQPDALALAVLGELRSRDDDSLLAAIAQLLGREGLALASQLDLGAELVAPVGRIAGRDPSATEWSDIVFGLPIARALGGLDGGQTVVVQACTVLALEAIEGTDAAIARGLAFAERGQPACVVKAAKPKQDPRFDVPTIGPDTLRAIAAGGGTALALEAGRAFVLDRDELTREAERAGIAVVGVAAESARP